MPASFHDLEIEAALAAHVGARLELADAAHGVLMHVLAIKANPPTYNAVVANMSDLLASEFGQTTTPAVVKASADIGAWADDPGLTGPQKQGKARERVGALQQELEGLGTVVDKGLAESVGRYLAISYRLGLAETTKPMGWDVDFTLGDRDAIHGLHNSGLFWIGKHYGDALGEMPQLLAEVDQVMLKGGLGRGAGGRAVAKIIGGKIKRSDAYWEGFAATVATRARSFGALSGLSSVGATRYEYVNPLDERTSDVCRALDGTLFTVKGGLQLRDKLLQAKTPEEWKAISPWPKHKDLLASDGKLKKPGELQAAGIAWPPLHFHCRSTIEVRIWTPLGEGELDPLGNVDPWAVKPPKAAPGPVALPDLVPQPVLPPPWEPDLPAHVIAGNPDPSDWGVMFELQGYEPMEIVDLVVAEPGLAAAMDIDDLPTITKLLAKHPPKVPRVFPADLIPDADVWAGLQEVPPKAWAIADFDKWLFKRGYTAEDLGVMFATDQAGVTLLPTNILGPATSRWQTARWLDLHPPGTPQLQALVDAKVAEIIAAEAAAEAAAQAVLAAQAAADAAAAAQAAAAAAAQAAADVAAQAAAAQAAADAAAALATQQAAIAQAQAAAQAAAQAQTVSQAAAMPGSWLPELAEDAPELAGWGKFKKWAQGRGYAGDELLSAEAGGPVAAAFEAYEASKIEAQLVLNQQWYATQNAYLTNAHTEAWRSASAILRARPPKGLAVQVIPWEPPPIGNGYPPIWSGKVRVRRWLRGGGYTKAEAEQLEKGLVSVYSSGAHGGTPERGFAAIRAHLAANPPSVLKGAAVYLEPGPVPLFYTQGGQAAAAQAVLKPAVQAASQAAQAAAAQFTKPGTGPDLATILGQQVGAQAGSNKGGFYLGTDGVKRYVKWYTNPAQAESENLANGIYRALGLGAPKTGVLQDGAEAVYWSEILEGATLGDVGLTAANAQQFMEGFAADVLTANWDSAGLSLDNALITKAGQLVRIDNGGSLLFRAQGTKKPAAVLNAIGEWDGFFDPKLNPSYAKIAAKAGYKSADDFLPVIQVQVEKMAALEAQHGGWAPLVETMAPHATKAEREAMAEMLSARLKLLQAKVAHLKPTAPVPLPFPAAAPGSVPKVPHVHVSAVPKGPVDVHGGYGWQPTTPGAGIDKWSPAQMKTWLGQQGYTDAEQKALWTGVADTIAAADLEAAKLGQAAGSLAPGHVVSFLEAKPPGSVVSLSVKPSAFLSPAELGTRLKATGGNAALPDLGEVFEDHLTGERWNLRFHQDDRQARSQVVANALYRRLGIEAPSSRVVALADGRTGVATPQFTGWSTSTLDQVAATHGEALAREMPADAFLGNWNVVGTDGRRLLVRANPIPGTSSVLRSNNDGVLAWRSTGSQKGAAWSKTDVTEMDTFLDPSKAPQAAQAFAQAQTDRGLMLPMMDRVAGLSNDEIDRAVNAGGFAVGDAQELRATLIGRRDAMAARAKALRKELKEEAEAAAQAAAARAARAAKGGSVVRRPRLGLDLRHADFSDGAVSFSGDHGYVRHQQITAQKYRMEKAGKVVHQGYQVRMQIDEKHWADVEQALQGKGAKNANYRAWARVGFGTKADTAADTALRFDQDAPSSLLSSGWTYGDGTVEIDFGGSIAEQAVKGELRLLLKSSDPTAAQAALERVMKELKIENAILAPTDDAAFVAGANRVLWNLNGAGHKRITDVKKCEAALKKAGVDAADVRVTTMGGRGFQTVEIKGRGQKYRKSGARFLYHEYSSADVTNSLMGTDGGPGGLLSTVDRTHKGIIKKGASSSSDIGTGGAQSVFTRLVGQSGTATSSWYESFGAHKVLLDPAILDRTDFYGFQSDKFGKTKGSDYALWKGADGLMQNLIHGGGRSNEVMFRHEIGSEHFLSLAASNASARDRMLKQLKDAGVKKVRGRPVEEFVVVMKNPTDFSGFSPKTNTTHAYLMGQAPAPAPWEELR